MDPYVLTWGGVGTPTCPGDSNATATLASSGCPCMFSGCIYDWASIDSLKVANYLWAGWQVVTITHLDGCQVTDSIFIEEAYPILDSLRFWQYSMRNRHFRLRKSSSARFGKRIHWMGGWFSRIIYR